MGILELAHSHSARYVYTVIAVSVPLTFWLCTGPSLAHRLEDAAHELARLCAHHKEFTATFSPQVISAWTRLVREWNADPFGAPSPYRETSDGMCYMVVLHLLPTKLYDEHKASQYRMSAVK